MPSSENIFIAHVRQNDSQQNNWIIHDLAEHCIQVGELAKQFANQRGGELIYLGGHRHDLGKYRNLFQQRIRVKSGYEKGVGEEAHIEQKAPRATHSNAGAIQLYQHDKFFGVILAYIIAGHHTGLPDWSGDQKSLSNRLQNVDNLQELTEALENAPQDFKALPELKTLLPKMLLEQRVTLKTFHIWIRYLFSCLVDADFLDTENFMSPNINQLRGSYPSLGELNKLMKQHLNTMQSSNKPSEVNQIRSQILEQCLNASQANQSIFTLTVPTGGGKTLSSMAFALEHAIRFDKKRIIYAIPFTSIIEQNAQVFKSIFDNEQQASVIEHHSNLEFSDDYETARTRLASENWDAPIIVTTNVQLFESLFASRTSQCRKIHNIADSVIVLDEAQKIPRDFQKPITEMMTELSKNYGVTWVLCTATQPKLDKTVNSFGKVLLEGLPTAYPIIQDAEQLVKDLERVKIHFPKDNTRLSWEQVASEIVLEPKSCVLAIVNTRSDAKALYQAIQASLKEKEAIVIHLSAGMCPAHRKLVILLINRILAKFHQGKLTIPFYVISTQLIEAGVDVDFPVVYRAMTGLDSIAQSAGRCNREGNLNELSELGKVVVFEPEKDAPQGELGQAQFATREILDEIKDDPLSPKAFYRYFTIFNAKGTPDKHQICEDLTAVKDAGTALSIKFRTASEKFSLIDDNGISVICPFYHPFINLSLSDKVDAIDKLLTDNPSDVWVKKFADLAIHSNEILPVEKLLNSLEKNSKNPSKDKSYRWIYRQLQQYTITIPKTIYDKNHAIFYAKAGLIVAREYDFWQGVTWQNLPMSGDDVVW